MLLKKLLKKNPALRAGFDLLKKNPRIAKKKLIFDEFSCCFERISKIFGASRRLLKKLLKKNPALRAGSYLLKNNLCLLKINLEKQLFFSKYRLFFSKILLKKTLDLLPRLHLPLPRPMSIGFALPVL